MSCVSGVCSPTAKKAVLNVNDLTNMLASEDVKITTGNGAVTIGILSPFSWTSSSRLTLDAFYTVSFQVAVTVAGTGDVTIVTNDGGSGGDLFFSPVGKLDFWDLTSDLNINQKRFRLVNSITALAAHVQRNPSGVYALANDYDAAADGTFSHPPIQFLSGTFEGLGHGISNLTINGKTEAGLFYSITGQGTVRDIDLINGNAMSAAHSVVAGLLASSNYGIVAHASASGKVRGVPAIRTGFSAVGGLVGLNDGTIMDSHSSATVISGNHTAVGGLVGYSESAGTILRCHSSGNVAGGDRDYAGGLAGWAYSIIESYATGAVTVGKHSLAGGLAGLGSIEKSFATGSVLGRHGSWLGGLAGAAIPISDSYATGAVQGGHHELAGGLVGWGGQVSRSYSIGAVAGGPLSLVGGLIGKDQLKGDLSNAYWDLDTSGITDPSQGAGNLANDPGIIGLTDVQLKAGLPDGFDPAIWGQNPTINNGYPYLVANPPPQ